MPVEIEGDYPYVVRVPTGLYGLDEALAGPCNALGMPLRCYYEIYGVTNAGKSSLSYYLLGRARPTGRVALCDLEGMDRDYLVSSLEQAHFDGKVTIIAAADKKGKARTHEDMLMEVADLLRTPEVSAALVDSVGAIVPIQQAEAELGEAVMGRRAKLVGDTAVRLLQPLRNAGDHKLGIFVNHVHSVIGGRGHITAGGDRMKYLAAVRINIYPNEVITDSDKRPLAFIAQGTVEKLRFGARGRKFKFAILPGIGVSPELTALVDAVELGLAKREATVKVGGASVGYLSKLIAELVDGRTARFEPFFHALEEHKRKTFGLIPPEEARLPGWDANGEYNENEIEVEE